MPEKPTNNREGADDYGRVVVRLDERTRVIAGACDIQWVLQTRDSRQWVGKMFFRSKAGLLRFCHPKPGSEAAAILDALPEMFPEGATYPWKAPEAAQNGALGVYEGTQASEPGQASYRPPCRVVGRSGKASKNEGLVG